MIKAGELRIDNYISFNGIVDKVGEITYRIDGDENKKGWVIDGTYEEDIQPIPLTPEILEKCGFEKGRGWYIGPLKMIEKEGKYLLSVDDNEYGFDEDGAIDVKHLHQLQNFYFALTGEELQVSL